MTVLDKHILILTPGFPKDESDVNCIPTLQIFIENFKNTFNDYNFSVISLHYPPTKSKYLWYNINVYSCGGKDISFPKRFKVWNDTLNYATIIDQQFPVSGIHSFWLGECAFLGNHLSKKFKIPHVNTLMGQELNSSNRYLRFINLKRMNIVALTDRQASIYSNKTKRSVDKIVPWGIRNDERVMNEDREFDILGVGSLIPGKNFEMFVDILYSIRNIFPKINAAIIGDGIEKERLASIILTNNLQNNLKLLGNLNRDEVLKLMSRSKIFLHTSKYESFGYVLAEALASGCYVVASETGFAQNTKKMFVANKKDEFIKIIFNLLKLKPDFTPEVPFAISDTTVMYKNMYDEIIQHK